MNIKRIKTAGYRGPGTNMQFMPPGWYESGDHLDIPGRVIPAELAAYLVETGQVAGLEAEKSPVTDVTVSEADLLLSKSDDQKPDVAEGPLADLVTDIDGEIWDMTLLNSMTPDELRALAKSEGATLPKGKLSKETLISLIVKKS